MPAWQGWGRREGAPREGVRGHQGGSEEPSTCRRFRRGIGCAAGRAPWHQGLALRAGSEPRFLPAAPRAKRGAPNPGGALAQQGESRHPTAKWSHWGPEGRSAAQGDFPSVGGFHSPLCPEGRRNRCKADGESCQGNPLHFESRVIGDHHGEPAGWDSQVSAHRTRQAARGHRAALPESEGRAACTRTSQGSQQRRPQSLGLQPQHQRCSLPRAEGTRGQAGPAQPSEAALHRAKPHHWGPLKGTWGCKGANGDGG